MHKNIIIKKPKGERKKKEMISLWIVAQADIVLYFIAISFSFIYTHITEKEHAYDVRTFVRQNLYALKKREAQYIAIHCIEYTDTSDDSRKSSSSSSESDDDEEEEEEVITIDEEEEEIIMTKKTTIIEIPQPVLIRAPKRKPNAVIRI